MIIVLSVVGAGLVLLIAALICRARGEDPEIIWYVFLIWLFAALVVSLMIPINRAATTSFIVEIESARYSIQLARDNGNISDLELAALQQKAIDYNSRLARDQYWAINKLSSWFFPRLILDIKPIR